MHLAVPLLDLVCSEARPCRMVMLQNVGLKLPFDLEDSEYEFSRGARDQYHLGFLSSPLAPRIGG